MRHYALFSDASDPLIEDDVADITVTYSDCNIMYEFNVLLNVCNYGISFVLMYVG